MLLTLFLRANITSLMQRVLEQRVAAALDKVLPIPSLMNPIPMDEGGYQKVGAWFFVEHVRYTNCGTASCNTVYLSHGCESCAVSI